MTSFKAVIFKLSKLVKSGASQLNTLRLWGLEQRPEICTVYNSTDSKRV